MDLILSAAIVTLIASLLGTGFRVLLHLAFRVPIQEVGFFLGPAVPLSVVRDVPIRIGLIPMGGYVKTVRQPLDREKRDPDAAYYETLPLMAKVLLAFAGTVPLAGVALGLLGPELALSHVSDGFEQILRGAVSPHEEAQRYLAAFLSIFEASPEQAAGILMAKLVALDLLPLPGTSLWKAGASAFKGAPADPGSTSKKKPSRPKSATGGPGGTLGCLAALIPLALFIGWATAIGFYLAERYFPNWENPVF